MFELFGIRTTANKSSNGCRPLLVEAGDGFDEVFGDTPLFVGLCKMNGRISLFFELFF